MAPTRRNTTVRLDDDLFESLQQVWEKDGILPAEQIRWALRAWFESRGVIPKTERKRADTRKRP
jgi:hypothetical protein